MSPECALTGAQKARLAVVGGECNYFFVFDAEHRLRWVDPARWRLDEMNAWSEQDIVRLLDVSERVMRECIRSMNLPARIVRKDRAIGMVRNSARLMSRDQLEETVLALHTTIVHSGIDARLPFCAFNGGSDVWCDIGSKHFGVWCLRNFYGLTGPAYSLHIGDQLSSYGNDYRAVSSLALALPSNATMQRTAATTGWVTSPAETVLSISQSTL